MADYAGFRDVSAKERSRLARSGAAMPDGSFPIANVQDLKNAIRAIGRAKNRSAAMAHIKRRARALNRTDLLPEEWRKNSEEIEAVEMLEEPEDTVEEFAMPLPGVEIFRTGKWKGDEYTVEDLDDMVSSFGKVGYDVPVKLGHTDDPGEPAYGWVESIMRVGDRLIANFRDVPDEIYEAIRNTRYDAVSSEIFFNLERGGRKFRRALKAVALLGAETPGVAGLKPLRESLRGFSEAELANLHSYTFPEQEQEITEMTDKPEDKSGEAELKALSEAQAAKIAELEAKLAEGGENGAELKKLTEKVAQLEAEAAAAKEATRELEIERKAESCKIPAVREFVKSLYSVAYGYSKAVRFTFKDSDGKDKTDDVPAIKVVDDMVEFFNDQAGKLFAELAVTGELRRDKTPEGETPGHTVDAKVKELRAKDRSLSYSAALKAVLADPKNAELKASFGSV